MTLRQEARRLDLWQWLGCGGGGGREGKEAGGGWRLRGGPQGFYSVWRSRPSKTWTRRRSSRYFSQDWVSWVQQRFVEQHSVEHNVDIPDRGGVGRRGALHGSVRRDLTFLGQVRFRTAMEVMRWFVDPARGFTFTSEEQFSMVRLMPDYREIATASPGGNKYWAPC